VNQSVEHISPEDAEKILASTRKPKVLKRYSRTLEREEEERERDVLDLPNGTKVVAERVVLWTKTEHIVIREHSPESNYQDALDEFSD
jgi:hypothetical protein